MSTDSSPSQTPTVASMSQKQRGLPANIVKSSPLASSSSNPVTPETATFANSGGRRVSDKGKPLPSINVVEPSASSTSRPPPARGGAKARDLLRQHYGMGLGPPAPLPGRVDDPMDIGMP
jgi:vacuolar protein sorting-associated protein 51